MIGTAAAMLGGGLLSAGGSLLGGLLGKSSAEKAAEGQQQGAQQAGQKVLDATGFANPEIADAAHKAEASVSAVTGEAAGNVERAGQRQADLLNPYAGLGSDSANALAMRLPELTKAPTMDDLQIDPGFAFRLAEGQKTLERSAAARGGLLTGGTIKATERYAQGVASDEYQKAFDRYRATQGDAFSRLSGLTGLGLSAADKQGSDLTDASKFASTARVGGAEYVGNAERDATNLQAQNTINAAKTQGDYLTQGANAKAAGIITGANALNGGISSAAGAIGGSLVNGALLNALSMGPSRRPASTLPGGGFGAAPYSGSRINPDGSLTVIR